MDIFWNHTIHVVGTVLNTFKCENANSIFQHTLWVVPPPRVHSLFKIVSIVVNKIIINAAEPPFPITSH